MSTLITQYLGEGTAASRPATPSVATGCIAFYYATDTSTLSVWNGSSWGSVGGYSPGTAPTIVQSAHGNTGGATGGGAGLTMTSAPTNGILLVAMTFNPTTATANTGWTQLASNSSGTDYGTILYKVAGAGESTTQTPLSGTVAAPACMIIWEIAGANASPFVFTTMQAEQSGTSNSSGALPNVANAIFLGAIGLVSTSYNNSALINVTQDAKDTSGTGRQLAAGHSTLATAPLAQIFATFTGSASSKACGLVVTA